MFTYELLLLPEVFFPFAFSTAIIRERVVTVNEPLVNVFITKEDGNKQTAIFIEITTR